jgi:hypothetical protein
MSLDTEIKKANDAIASSLNMMEGLDVFQRQSLTVIMRMCYLKGLLESAKERERLHNLFMEDDDEDDE